ncbi:hypothetical protein AB1Y20_005998 [Prymnesium parvum]|uniref:J domain-containing protein n=1 Tax=Prymnesium parvum TaxID=97485 RepID=A0AB34J0G3_PRYPA
MDAELRALLAEAFRHARLDAQPQRFGVGERVQCRLSRGWILARVLHLNVEQPPGYVSAYLCQLDDGALLLVPHDSASFIRRASVFAELWVRMLALLTSLLDLLFPTQARYSERRQRGTGHAGEEPGSASSVDGGSSGGSGEGVPSDPFEILGLAPRGEGVDLEAINSAYKKLALHWHPDKNGGSAESVAMMQRLNSAKAACLDHINPQKGENSAAADEEANEAEDQTPAADEWRDFERFQKKRNEEWKKLRREMAKARKKAAQRQRREAEVESSRDLLSRPETLSASQLKKAQRVVAEAEAEAPAVDGGDSRGGRTEMDLCVDPVACALRSRSFQALSELLTFERSPLGPLDEQGNTPLHYAAYLDDVSAVNAVVQLCGKAWWKAVLLQNRQKESPLQLAVSVGGAAGTLDRLRELHQQAESREAELRATAQQAARAASRKFDPLGLLYILQPVKDMLNPLGLIYRMKPILKVKPFLAFAVCYTCASQFPGVQWIFSTVLGLAAAVLTARRS